jgi:SSS family solute:Na+ symporter
MNMTLLDWTVTAAVLGIFVFVAMFANRMTKSVADYLVAGRGAGRYMLTVSSGTEWIGVIAISAMFEAFYIGGLNAMWWSMATTPLFAYLQISGFGMYRFRETRAMTIAEFLEKRYSRTVRTLGAAISWVSGMVAFGFVPLITAKFLMALIGLPADFACLGFQIPTYPVMTALVVGLPLLFVLSGGHLTVLVSDFVQGMFMNIAALTLVFTLLSNVFHWDHVVSALITGGGENASLLNPLATSQMADFGPGFFFTAVVLQAYSVMSNVAAQGFTGSAKNAHELRMGNLLAQIRWQGVLVFFMAFVLVTHMYMHHPAHADTAAAINHSIDLTLGNQGDDASVVGAVARTQMLVPTALTYMLPHGMIGLFCAMMVAALISSSNAMTHAWGSVLMQDIILPLRKKPLGTRHHIWALRASVLTVALITFALSLLIKPTQSIMQCLALFGSLWLGSAGAVILGGLYWKKGTTKAAIITLIFGLVVGTALLILTQLWVDIAPHFPALPAKFPLSGQVSYLGTAFASILLYVVVSLLDKQPDHDMDQLLHRGKYTLPNELLAHDQPVSGWQRIFGITRMFNREDRVTAYFLMGYFLLSLLVFATGMVIGVLKHPTESQWAAFWGIFLIVQVCLLVTSTLWLGIGGVRDTLRLFVGIKAEQADDADTGEVRHNNH